MKTIRNNLTGLLHALLTTGCLLIATAGMAQTGGGIYEDGPLMNRTRIAPVTSVGEDGNVIVFGGRESGFVSSMYTDIYNPQENSFTEVAMNYPHDGSAVVALSDGKYFISGGSYDLGIPAYNSAEIFNPESNSFTSVSNMMYARMQHSGVQIGNGKILIAGGWYDNTAATYAELYDITVNSYSAAGSLIVPRASPVILPTDDGGAVLFGGWPSYGGDFIQTVEYYNPILNTFELYYNDPIETDPGWHFYPVSRPVSDLLMNNGKYMLRAYRSSPETEYALISFDPSTKAFEVMMDFPITSTITNGGFYDVVLDKAGNMAFLLGVDALAVPTQVGIVVVDLTEQITYYPDDLYSLNEGEYLYPTLTFIPSNNKILVVGFSTETGSYFYATNQSMLITPEIYSGIENPVDGSQNIACYPNPFRDQFRIELTINQPGDYTIEMIDLQGRIVYGSVISENHTGNVYWEFNNLNLPSGLYQITIIGESMKASESIMLTK